VSAFSRQSTVPVIAGLVLAGGRGTRMGGVDKPLLMLADRSLIEIIIERLSPQVGPLAISANGDPERYTGFGLKVLADDITGRGPLGGILRGLAWAGAEGADSLLSIPGDTPFIPTDLVQRLSPAPSWAENSTALHPLVALWPVGCAPALGAWLAAQPSGRVRAFGATLGMRSVWFNDTPDPFHNINTQADLDHARARV
jgi:molybdopterin-guanine dinucleotide biosynthesis protein A